MSAAMQLLLEKGVDVEAKDSDGLTLLHHAAENGHEALVHLLLENGADVKAKEDKGLRALDLAASNGHEAIVKLLNRARPSPFQQLKLSLLRGWG
jgi:ankyrin repeat protein